MEILPNEVICHILDFCSEIPLKIAAVCSFWRRYCFKEKSFDWLISNKIQRGDLVFLQNILNEKTWNFVVTRENLKLVAKYGRVHIFNWFYDLEPPPPIPKEKFVRSVRSLISDTAVKEGQICILEALLLRRYFEYKGYQLAVYKLAAKHGRIDVIQWAEGKKFHNNGKSICQNAARGGQLETLKWLRERNYPWDHKTTLEAARSRHEEIVKWSIENGCEHNSSVFAMAVETCTLDLVKWLWEKNYPVDLTNSVARSCQGAKIETANWLISQGLPFDKEKCLDAFALRKKYEKEHYIYMVSGKWV